VEQEEGMELNVKWVIHAVINLSLVLILLATPYLIPVCTGAIATAAGGTTPMKCHWCMLAELALSIPLIVIVVSQFFMKSYTARQVSAAFLLPLAAMIILVPQNFFIGVCKTGMPCNSSKLAWVVVGGALIVNALLQIRFSLRQKKYSF